MKQDYLMIKDSELIIEENRLAIREKKNIKSKLHNKMDTIGNIYEYLAIPLCSISIVLVSLLSGVSVYLLPAVTAVGAISVISYKFTIREKMDNLNKDISELKRQRGKAYRNRERAYEKIFRRLHERGMDVKDYYHQIKKASSDCEELTKIMAPYKAKRNKLDRSRTILSKVFDYVLAPFGTIALPVVCSFANMEPVGEIICMGATSSLLLSCAMIDDWLSKRIGELDDTIEEIKSDRTVMYVKRDLKLKESLNFLIECENKELVKVKNKQKNNKKIAVKR